MKRLSVESMSQVNGSGFMDGLCGAVKVAALTSPWLGLTPTGAGVLLAGGVSCALWSAFK